MTYKQIKTMLETYVTDSLECVFEVGELPHLNVFVEKSETNGVMFFQDISDQNTNISYAQSMAIINELPVKFYVLKKHSEDALDYDLDEYYSDFLTLSNKLIYLLNNHLGETFDLKNIRTQRVKMRSPNLFAGLILTFTLSFRGECS